MSRVLVDLPESHLIELSKLVKAEGRPRAAIIRDAVDAYLAPRRKATGNEVFGRWKGRGIEGLEYQEKLRSEW